MGPIVRLSVKQASLLLLAALFAACAERDAVGEGSADPAAPFLGPAQKLEERFDPPPLVPPAPPQPVEAIAAPAAPPGFPETAASDGEAARRLEIWASSRFRCRAISTTKLRTCKLAPSPAGWSITFPIADLTCDEVVFDGAGDPAQLRGCRSAWLRVPASIALKRSAEGDVWSGGHSGWRWPNDGERYCCPGVWIEAPAALRGK